VQGSSDKVAAIYQLGTELGVETVEMAYMGDDLVDIPAMRLVGLAAAPADARPEALAAAAWVAARGGGRGAVRDLCEHLLREMGRWDEVAARFQA
ncbi:MAG: HAD hydrolase family protein, partial [Planctomycetota bacterium]